MAAGHPRVPRREEEPWTERFGSGDARRRQVVSPAGPPFPAGRLPAPSRGHQGSPAERGAQSSRIAARGAAEPGRSEPSRAAGRAQKRRARRPRLGVGDRGTVRSSAGRGSALSGDGTGRGGCPGGRRMPAAARRGGARVLWGLLWVALARCYNVDVGRPVVFQGPNGSFFGYSVLQHYHDSTRW